MSPRRSAVEARTTRDTIVSRAVGLASVDGLEGLSIGRLATELSMSKSGVLGHFGTKQALQLAAVREVVGQFHRRVVQPALMADAGMPRLLALCDNWIGYLADTGLPGGCFLTAAACEFDGRPGDVRDLVAHAWAGWRSALRAELVLALSRREIPDLDVDQAVFELVALGPAVNQAVQLHADQAAPERAIRAVRRILGLA